MTVYNGLDEMIAVDLIEGPKVDDSKLKEVKYEIAKKFLQSLPDDGERRSFLILTARCNITADRNIMRLAMCEVIYGISNPTVMDLNILHPMILNLEESLGYWHYIDIMKPYMPEEKYDVTVNMHKFNSHTWYDEYTNKFVGFTSSTLED